MTYSKWEEKKEVGSQPPTLDGDLGARIDLVAKSIGNREIAAKAAGISTVQLIKYVKGKANPSFSALANLVKGTSFSLDWLATGDAKTPNTNGAEEEIIDELILKSVVEELENYLRTRKLSMEPGQKAIAINALYHIVYYHKDDYKDGFDDQDVDKILRTMNE